MRIKRTARPALAGVLAIVAISGMTPRIAAAEPHARTAPYDFGVRCIAGGHYPDLYTYRCGIDPAAIETGVIGGVGGGGSPDWFRVYAYSYSSSVGIYFDVGEPGRLSVTVELDHRVSDSTSRPYACANVTNVDTGSRVGTLTCNYDQLQVTGWASAGKHEAVVEVNCYYYDACSDLLNPIIAKMITYEVTTN